MKNNILIKVIVILIIIVGIIIVIYPDNKYKDEISKLEIIRDSLNIELEKSNIVLDSLDQVILGLEMRYKDLSDQKGKIKIQYEIRLQTIDDTITISNDSITKYIASKIRYRW